MSFVYLNNSGMAQQPMTYMQAPVAQYTPLVPPGVIPTTVGGPNPGAPVTYVLLQAQQDGSQPSQQPMYFVMQQYPQAMAVMEQPQQQQQQNNNAQRRLPHPIPAPNLGRPVQRRTPSIVTKCFQCGEEGHKVAQCPQGHAPTRRGPPMKSQARATVELPHDAPLPSRSAFADPFGGSWNFSDLDQTLPDDLESLFTSSADTLFSTSGMSILPPPAPIGIVGKPSSAAAAATTASASEVSVAAPPTGLVAAPAPLAPLVPPCALGFDE